MQLRATGRGCSTKHAGAADGPLVGHVRERQAMNLRMKVCLVWLVVVWAAVMLAWFAAIGIE